MFLLASFACGEAVLHAQLGTPVPNFIAHYGDLIGADAAYTGPGQFKFALVSPTAPITTYWRNDNNGLSALGEPVVQPTQALDLQVIAGSFGKFLGYSDANNLPIPYQTFSHPRLRVRVWYRKGTTGSFVQLPDADLPAAAYAMQIPDASVTPVKLAPNAVTSAALAPGAVGSGKIGAAAITVGNVATPAAPAAGQVLSFNGGQLAWTNPAGVFSLNGTNAYYNGGNVGVGTMTPSSKVDIAAQNALTLIGDKPFMTFRDTSASNRASFIQGVNGDMLLLTSSKATIVLKDNAGNVGIGTSAPTTKFMIVDGLAQFGYTQGSLRSGYLGGSSLDGGELNVQGGWNLNNGGRVRLGGSMRGDADVNVIQFFQNSTERMRINNGGNVGIGTATPIHRLAIAGGPPFWTTEGWGGSVELGNGTAIAWGANAAGQRFGLGHSTTGGGFFRSVSPLGTTTNPPLYDLFINDNGNVGMGTTTAATKLDVRGDIYGTRLFLRADPVAPTNAAVLCESASVTTFVPYNTARGRALNLLVDAASVRTLEIRGGSDLAEPFQMKEDELPKGSVVVIDDENPGRLMRSHRAYDTRVAGIVSGANGVNAGISLHQEGMFEGGQNVALTGRVYVQADASGGPIRPGDLLTTSDLPGHAMKVADPIRAQGAILGKAMSALPEGTGMVLVLVTLQ